MYRMLTDDQIGGGWVRRPGGIKATGSFEGQDYKGHIPNGVHLPREWLIGVRKATRAALVSIGDIELYPTAPPGERFIVSRGEGVFDVVEGRRINPAPLSSKEARALMAA